MASVTSPFSPLLLPPAKLRFDFPSLSTFRRSASSSAPSISLSRPKVTTPSSSSSSFLSKFLPQLPTSSTHQNHQYLQHLPPRPYPSHYDEDNDDNDALSDRCRHFIRLSVRLSDAHLGKSIHSILAKVNVDNTRLHNSLVVMYLKFGHLDDARKVFDGLSSPDVASYSVLISGYAKGGQELEAVDLFFHMRVSGVEPNEFAFVSILTSCIRNQNLQFALQIHALTVKTNFISCVFVSNALMGVYVNCGLLGTAVKLFDEMPIRDVTSWNTVISGLVKELQCDRAFELFRDMQMDGCRADQFSLSSLLTAAAEVCARVEGKEIHAHALRTGFESNLSVNNALMGFYTKCGSIENVEGLFQRMSKKDVISWTGMMTGFMEFGLVESAVEVFDHMPERNCIVYNALLAGFCRNGEGLRALELFKQMIEDGKELSDCTLTSIVNACAMLLEVSSGEQIHGFVIKVGFGSNDQIEAALLDMCTKCGRIDDAQKMFDRWVHNESRLFALTSLICGYAQNGQPDKAMSLFCMVQTEEGSCLDEFTLTTVLSICGTLGFDKKGKQLHSCIIKSGFLSDLAAGNALVSMYAKCGNMNDATKIFNLMPDHDIVSWNTLISVHHLHRQGDQALDVMKNMEMNGIKPDDITFVLIISSCRYTKSNSVDTCRSLFISMRSRHGIEPTSEHYAAMVDVLGYYSCFDEAEELIEKMPFKPDASVWRALLDSCRLRSNISLGKQAAQHLLALEPQDPSMYILVSNLYSASGRWHCSERVRQEMREKGLHKHPARSWVIHHDAIHSFFARDKSHPQAKDVNSALEILILECIKVGYVPDTSFVLHEVEEYQKRDFLFYHSAKLAATYGLLMATPGRPVRVMKNIHLCGDCHTFLKFASVAAQTEISLRDATGFHCFSGGKCSCGDYW